jgi:hypothetical protein
MLLACDFSVVKSTFSFVKEMLLYIQLQEEMKLLCVMRVLVMVVLARRQQHKEQNLVTFSASCRKVHSANIYGSQTVNYSDPLGHTLLQAALFYKGVI